MLVQLQALSRCHLQEHQADWSDLACVCADTRVGLYFCIKRLPTLLILLNGFDHAHGPDVGSCYHDVTSRDGQCSVIEGVKLHGAAAVAWSHAPNRCIVCNCADACSLVFRLYHNSAWQSGLFDAFCITTPLCLVYVVVSRLPDAKWCVHGFMLTWCMHTCNQLPANSPFDGAYCRHQLEGHCFVCTVCCCCGSAICWGCCMILCCRHFSEVQRT